MCRSTGCWIAWKRPWCSSTPRSSSSTRGTRWITPGRAIKALKRFAKAFDVHLIIVAHPAKQQKDEKGEYRVPTLYDISDSAHWYNKADLGVIVHRFSDYSLIKVAKSRYHDEIGVPGDVQATFHFEERKFEPWAKPI